MRVSNWGNYPKIDATVFDFSEIEEIRNLVLDSSELIPRGLGRCYGDSALNTTIASTLRYRKILEFDEKSGFIKCEAGVSVKELLDIFIPRGWFLPVTPGTKFVTVGGAIASDVHGKNHHIKGSISNHIISMDVLLYDGSTVTCSREENSELFWATCGGMGLTGIILNASFKLLPIETSYICQETLKAKNIDELMNIFEDSAKWTYSFAWVDCMAKGKELGRSVLARGEHATREDLRGTKYMAEPLRLHKGKKITVPFNLPNITLNRFILKIFNFFCYRMMPDNPTKSIVSYERFFYPLDAIHNLNKIYGPRGFTQYQLVLPKINSRKGIREILTKITQSGEIPFLAGLKLFGKQDSFISFPQEGYTLAVEFPITPSLFAFLDDLDKLLLEYGGRLYLTKDVRMSSEMFKKTYVNSENFIKFKHQIDKSNKFQSLQSKRIKI